MRILIACIGNIFHGDDAFGVEVARRLAGRSLPPEARLVDFGIRSFDLAYALLDGYDVAILVDATSRGQAPGTLYTLEIDPNAVEEREESPADLGAHGMNPASVLRMARAMGGSFGRILLVGCEPETLDSDEEGMMGLSPTVQAAVDVAADMVEALALRFLEVAREQPGQGAAA